MRPKILCVAATITLFGAYPALAVTFETTNFISSPTSFNGFEGISSAPNFSPPSLYVPTGTPYSEGGITVTYIGNLPNGGTVVNSSFASGTQGLFSWYGPGNGYTDVKLTSGSQMQTIQFLATSGFGNEHPTVYLDYQLLDLGSIVSTGSVGIPNNRTMNWYGFAGGGFDEVRLQVVDGNSPFDPNAFDAGAYDSFGAVAVTPLPPTWGMMLLGLGVLGFMGYRRKKAHKDFGE